MEKIKNAYGENVVLTWLPQSETEESAADQIFNLTRLPFRHKHVAVMPDCHAGCGMPIGTVLATKGVIIPNAVGVDIGCGMCAVRTSLKDLDKDTLKKIMGEIRKAIPVGFNKHKKVQHESNMPDCIARVVADKENYVVARNYENALKSLGTLGGGNHFIEIQEGSDGYIWIMIHSGSRNLGNQVAKHYDKIAQKINQDNFSIVDKDWGLAFLKADSKEGKDYISEMQYCVDYAKANRNLMMERVKEIFFGEFGNGKYEDSVVGISFDAPIDIAHNYAALENHLGSNVWVHRKGATRARLGEVGIIPGSQGSKSYIVRGLGNKLSYESCSHGAGRKMSRGKARAELDLKAEQEHLDLLGVLHSVRGKDNLDEAPSAYKDIEEVMKHQKDLVDISVILVPLAVIKG